MKGSDWQDFPPLIDGDPFALARSSCLHAVQVARDVRIDEAKLQSFAMELDCEEIRRLAGHRDPRCAMSEDFHRAVAPVDNVIPAMLAYHGVLSLSPTLYLTIHQRQPLERGPKEAELRSVALVACDWIVAAAKSEFNFLDLGYYLWRSGKAPKARQFPRHHTKNTIFY